MINFDDVLNILRDIDNPNIQQLREFVEGRVWCGYGQWAPHVADLDKILKKLSNQELMVVANALLGSGNTDVEQLVVWLMSRSLEVNKLVTKIRDLDEGDNNSYSDLRKRLGESEVVLHAIARWGDRALKDMAIEEVEKGEFDKDIKLKEKLERNV